MHAFEGQRSGNPKVKQSLTAKKELLRKLRNTVTGMKFHSTASVRQSLQKRIADLEAELALTAAGGR
ncbi:MAG: hypothetical protein AB7O80_25375 [Acetobacteraceae bacterium]